MRRLNNRQKPIDSQLRRIHKKLRRSAGLPHLMLELSSSALDKLRDTHGNAGEWCVFDVLLFTSKEHVLAHYSIYKETT